MQKAANMNQLANNLIPENFLKSEDENVYVPIYTETLKILRSMVINDELESQAFFVAGQAGTGKTTALNFFQTPSLVDLYCIKYMNMRDYLDSSDVDIIDVLLAFAFSLVKGTELEKEYYKELDEMRKVHEGELTKTSDSETAKSAGSGIETDLGSTVGFFSFIKLGARYFANLRMDSNYRKTTREIFKLQKPALLQKVNEIIDHYIEKISKGKKLLVIIDDLDKLKDVPLIQSIFIENRSYLFELKCKKIISIPLGNKGTDEIYN